ncbi:hypothetical protein SCD_n00238 [Sulfuricella denitrificans skB26]|uniref:Uncharacterized protein n=1 Tax=Sulfuricella denitrificans (strain DSM 22764 / NBRC 105220 / skB26) TaxID=1163617 RepID=S6B013_SULDS|nr:hypothetical protein SCD_n00238 [Sulfuricella denitrificans skB26]
MQVHLELSLKELAERLQLASTSTLRKALSGKGGMDIERLQLLAAIPTRSGALPNLDWLLTGRGPPTISPYIETNTKGVTWANWLSDEKLQALRVLTSSPFPASHDRAIK